MVKMDSMDVKVRETMDTGSAGNRSQCTLCPATCMPWSASSGGCCCFVSFGLLAGTPGDLSCETSADAELNW